jgi:hypothetical protein
MKHRLGITVNTYIIKNNSRRTANLSRQLTPSNLKKYILYPTLFVVCIAGLFSCSDDDNEEETPQATPVITGFSPQSGIVGNEVTINGTDFSATASTNVVKFNGVAAEVTSASATELVAVVPADATSGKITVTIGDNTSTSSGNFTILAPTIASVNYPIVSPGLEVTITGTNYSPVKTNNVVHFGDVAATVNTASAAELKVIVPAGAATGKFRVKVGSQSATTANDFDYCSGKSELLVTNVETTATNAEKTQFTFSYTITNVGDQDLDLSKYVLQNYVSEDALKGISETPAGGTVLDAGGVLSQGESYTTSWQSNVNYNGKPYLLMDIHPKDIEAINECNLSNNLVVHAIE